MASMNRVFLIGNLTRDPEVRYLPSGQAVTDLRLAVSHKYRTQSGEDKEDTCFVDVKTWGRTAETCGQYLSKGAPALVEGRLKYEEWEKDGKKSSRLHVVADRVQFLGAPRRNAEVSDGPGGEAPAAKPPRPPPPAGEQQDGAVGVPPGGDEDNLPF